MYSSNYFFQIVQLEGDKNDDSSLGYFHLCSDRHHSIAGALHKWLGKKIASMDGLQILKR